MTAFRKYSFPDESTAKQLCENFDAVYIGIIPSSWDEEGNPIAFKEGYAVDILWDNQPDDSLKEYVVWPHPIGVHTFAGQDDLYLTAYNEHHANTAI